jgi:hypothetical protein
MIERPKSLRLQKVVAPKRSRATLDAMVLAKFVADLHQVKGGHTPAEARDLVMLEWLSHGDAGPFLAWSADGVGADVLRLLSDMLRGDADLPYHLVIKRHRGQPAKPGLQWRDMAMALCFEKHRDTFSAEVAFQTTARDLGVSVSTIREAVRRSRKRGQEAEAGRTN